MGKYVTISNDYLVIRLDNDGEYDGELTLDNPLYTVAMDFMAPDGAKLAVE